MMKQQVKKWMSGVLAVVAVCAFAYMPAYAENAQGGETFQKKDVSRITLEAGVLGIQVEESKDNQIHFYADTDQSKSYTVSQQGASLAFTKLDSAFIDGDVRLSIPKNSDLIVNLVTTTGDIEVKNISAKSLILRSKAGNLDAENITVDLANFNSASGDVELTESTCKKAIIKTAAGKIGLQAKKLAHITAISATGDITLATDVNAPTVIARSNTGDIDVSLPQNASVSYVATTRTGKVQIKSKDSKRSGKIGDGKGRIQAVTSTGDITVDTK